MVKKNTEPVEKPKARKLDITQLVITSAHERVSKTSGKPGFFGKAMDPSTGKRYQIVSAVEIG